ncbi:MAG: hypothetical protein HKN14_06010 [Marinicaulis sp.]|nr:hypothetical protein [Marinicaulis sp.]NNL88559.1 hypothetical protein [Marinicaulis sp.]
MHKTFLTFTTGVVLAACGGETTTSPSSDTIAAPMRSIHKTEIASPPDPCVVLTANRAQSELGVADLANVTPAPENKQSGAGSAPWSCAYSSGGARIALIADWSAISSAMGSAAVADAYGNGAGGAYEAISSVGVANIMANDDSGSHVVLWSALAPQGDQSRELIVRATIADPGRSASERAEIATALAEIYLMSAQQKAAERK